jgi:hypothetical protein
MVFSVGSMQRLYLENENTNQLSPTVCSQSDQSESEAAVGQSTLVEAWEAESLNHCKPLHSNTKLVVRKVMNTEAAGSTALEAIIRQ